MFISYGTDSPKTKIAILLNLSQGGSQICQVKHLFVKPKRVRNSKVNQIWKRIHGILLGGLASFKVNPELSQNKRHGHLFVKPKRVRNSKVNWIWKRIHGILHGGLASVKVNPELSQNKRHGQWNEQIIKKKYRNFFIKYCFALVGPDFDQLQKMGV